MVCATEKQKRYAQDIAGLLDIPLPQKDDLEEYSKFIKEHLNQFHRIKNYIEKKERECQGEYSIQEVESRLYLQTVQSKQIPVQLATPENVICFLQEYMKGMSAEHIIVLNLDIEQHPINYSKISIGTINSSQITGRELFKTAVLSNAAGILMCHNHLGNHCIPSVEDINLTRQMICAGNILGIPLIDHVIVSSERPDGLYFSFRETHPSIFKEDNADMIPDFTPCLEDLAVRS